jgi:hypothetical protein
LGSPLTASDEAMASRYRPERITRIESAPKNLPPTISTHVTSVCLDHSLTVLGSLFDHAIQRNSRALSLVSLQAAVRNRRVFHCMDSG